ncbi:MAG TPA: ABC transporter permease [Candidatus Limnocylindrales bacterium]|nr:ABC transporter permease [Candidatus Limnocylindrales bacterium]
MGKLLQDIRYALRILARSPGFTAVAILTLALGIGANTAIFSLIDAVMLRSLPAENPSQLVLLKWSARNAPKIQGYMSAGDCPSDLRFGAPNPSGCSFSEPFLRKVADSKQFSGVAAFSNAGPLSLTGVGTATLINGQLVSGDFFRTLGTKAAAGRLIETADDSPSAAPVAVLNYGYWRSTFGGSPSAIGKTIQLNDVSFTIVGVAEQRFDGITPGSDYDVWLPLSTGGLINSTRMWSNRQDNVSYWWLTILGRLKTESSLPQTQAAVSGIFSNEMLHGSVPLFEAGGMFGPGGPPPGGPGAGMVRRQIVMGGPPPGAGGRPTPLPQGAGPGGPVVIHGAPPPGAAGQKPPKGHELAVAPANAPPAKPGAEEAKESRTLSKPDDNPAITLVNAQAGLTGSRGRFRNPLYVLMFAVGIILLIACSNVAGLMLARAAARQREMAVRLALGAGRARIVRQLLTESILLASIGGILGVLFASWGSRAIISFVSNNQPRPMTFATGLDLRVLGFTIGISLLTGILFGLAPAFRGAQVDLTPALKEGSGISSSLGHGARRFTIANALVVTQVALAIIVLIGAGLLVRTLQNLRSIDVGFDAHNLVIFGINPSLAGYKTEAIDSFYRDLQGRLTETPGVHAVSYSMVPLLSGALMMTGFHWPGTPQDRESEANMLGVGPDFFTTMEIPFLMGRGFNASDYAVAAHNGATAPTSAPTPVIVNQAFVSKFVGKENPLGKLFGQSPADDNGPASPGYEIVGVVRDAKYSDLRQDISPTMYSPQAATPMGASFEVRTAADPKALVPAIRAVVAQMNPNLPLRNLTTQSQQIDRLLFQERLVARLSSFFGSLALILACIGLYGLLSYEVARRTREIGIRMALGAQVGDVLRLVVKQGLALALVGSIVGVAAALAVTHYLNSLLYGVHANDPGTIVVVAVLLALVALAACLIPARRAAQVDPIVALRHE